MYIPVITMSIPQKYMYTLAYNDINQYMTTVYSCGRWEGHSGCGF